MRTAFLILLVIGLGRARHLSIPSLQIQSSGLNMHTRHRGESSVSLTRRSPMQSRSANRYESPAKRQGSPPPSSSSQNSQFVQRPTSASSGVTSTKSQENLALKNSRSHGRQGRATSPERSGSPDSVAHSATPVSIKATIHGPGAIVISGARDNRSSRRRIFHFHDAERNEKLEKEFSNPRKLVLYGYSRDEGGIEISSSGRKVWTKVSGPEDLQGMARSIGPGLQYKQAKWTVKEETWPYDNTNIGSPVLKETSNRRRKLTGIVRTAGHEVDSKVAAEVWARRDAQVDVVASNSPSHSPPQSPGRLHPQHPFYYDQYPGRKSNRFE